MKRLAIIILFAIASTAEANPKPEPIKPEPIALPKAKVTPSAPKSGELVVIDASAASGNVRFDHDFAPGTFMIDGKKMTVAVPAAQPQSKVYWVRVTFWKEELSEKIDIKVLGTDGPQPEDPLASPIDKLGVKIDALTKIVSSLDARVKSLEGAKPPPVADPFVKALQDAYNADGRDAAALARLISLYKLSPSVVTNPNYAKEKDILDVMHTAAQSSLGEPDPGKVTVLPNVRRVLANEFNAVIGGKTGTALDDNARRMIGAEFLKAQHALEELK